MSYKTTQLLPELWFLDIEYASAMFDCAQMGSHTLLDLHFCYALTASLSPTSLSRMTVGFVCTP